MQAWWFGTSCASAPLCDHPFADPSAFPRKPRATFLSVTHTASVRLLRELSRRLWAPDGVAMEALAGATYVERIVASPPTATAGPLQIAPALQPCIAPCAGTQRHRFRRCAE